MINKRRDKETPSWWIFIPFAITNPQIDFGYLNIETNKKSRFSSYVYYHHKIDYFAKNENDFWRFKVGLGLGVVS